MKNKLVCPEPIKFTVWLHDFVETLKGNNAAYVPCGDCVGCCTSSYFVHIKPTDRDSIKRIPGELMFPAPGLPTGHHLLGYDENGHCPMFKKGRCSIYKYRPETCRQYDCRIYKATGIYPDDSRPQIYRKAKGWQFDISSVEDMKAFEAIRRVSKFLLQNRELFPKEFFPRNSAQKAVLAIRIYSDLMQVNSREIEKSPQAFVDSIVLKYGDRDTTRVQP